MKGKLLLLLAACFLLWGCTGPEGPPVQEQPEHEGAVTLHFYTWSDEDPYMGKAVEAFNGLDYPFTVEYHSITPQLSVYYDTMADRLAWDDTIDIVGINGAVYLSRYVNNGYLLPLGAYLRKHNTPISDYGPIFSEYGIGGEVYAMPTRKTTWMLIYNPRLFEEQGVSYPVDITWEEYRQMARQMTWQDGEKQIWGTYLTPYYFNIAAVQKRETLIDDSLTYTWDSVELCRQIYGEDRSAPDLDNMADQDIMYDLYQKGELSSLIIGEWFLNWLTEEELAGRLDEPYAVAHLPVHDSSYLGQSTGQLMMAGISAQSRHPEEAYLFLEYLTGPEGARILAENRIVPAYYSDEIKEIYIRSIDNQTVGQIFDWRIDMEMPPYEYIGEINHVFHVYAGAYIRGELSREEMIAAFEEARRQIALGNGEQGV